MSSIDNSKKAIIAGIAVLAVFAFAVGPLVNSQKASAWGDDDWDHHHHHHWDDWWWFHHHHHHDWDDDWDDHWGHDW